MDDFVMSLTCEEYYYYDEDWDDYDHSVRCPMSTGTTHYDMDDDW